MASRKRKPSKRTLSLRARRGWETRRAREAFEREAAEFLEREVVRQERAVRRRKVRTYAPPEPPPRRTRKRRALPVEREGVEAPPETAVVLFTRAMMPVEGDGDTGEVNDFFFQTVLPALYAGGELDATDKLAPYVGRPLTFLIAGEVTAFIRGRMMREPFNLIRREIRGQTPREYLKALGTVVRDFAKLTNQTNGGDLLGSPFTYLVNYVAFLPPS